MHNNQTYSKDTPHTITTNPHLKTTSTTTNNNNTTTTITTTPTSICITNSNPITTLNYVITSNAVSGYKKNPLELKSTEEIVSTYPSSTLNVVPIHSTCIVTSTTITTATTTTTSIPHPITVTTDLHKNELSTGCLIPTPINIYTTTSTGINTVNDPVTTSQLRNVTSFHEFNQSKCSDLSLLRPNRPSLIRRKANISESDAFDIVTSVKNITTSTTHSSSISSSSTSSSNKSSIVCTRDPSMEINSITKKINSFEEEEEDQQKIASSVNKIEPNKLLTTSKVNLDSNKMKFNNTRSTSTCTSQSSTASPLDPNLLHDSLDYSTSNKVKDSNNKMKSKDIETFNSGLEYKTMVKSASISPTKKYRLKHQISQPMNPRNRSSRKMSSSYYYNSDTSFLSMLAASRPSAAKGLLGVASAALAAARAGTFINNPVNTTSESMHKMDNSRNSRSVERNQQQINSGFCFCHYHHCPYKYPPYPHDQQPKLINSPSSRLNWLNEQLSLYGYTPRRYSDPALNVTDDKMDMVYIKLLLYLSQKSFVNDEYDMYKTNNQYYYPLDVTQKTDDADQTNHALPINDPMTLPLKTDDYFLSEFINRNSAVYSSLMDLNIPDFLSPTSSNVGEIGKCNSTVLLNRDHAYIDLLETKTNPKTSKYFTSNMIQQYSDNIQQPHQFYYDEKPNQHTSQLQKHDIKEMINDTSNMSKGISYGGIPCGSTVTPASHPTKSKRTGLDAIGMDFIRANGARPGLIQLRHVKEFKAAKELENQQRQQQQQQQQQTSRKDENQETKTKIKHSNISKYPCSLGLFPTRSSSGGSTGGPVGISQQSPFHHLISGGVLGATVLTLAAKDGRSTKELKDVQKQQHQLTTPQLQSHSVSQLKEQLNIEENNKHKPLAQQRLHQNNEALLDEHHHEYNCSNLTIDPLAIEQVMYNHEVPVDSITRDRHNLSSDTSNASKTSQPVSEIHPQKHSYYYDKMKYQLARSATVTSSSPRTKHNQFETIHNSNLPETDMTRLQETLSVPGLVRGWTDDSDYTDEYNIYKRQNSYETNDRPPSHDSSNMSLHTHSANTYNEMLFKQYETINENQSGRLIQDHLRVGNMNVNYFSKQPSLDRNDVKNVQFNKELNDEQRSNSVTNYLNTCQTSYLNSGCHSRIRRLRENFEKTKSSTYTWRPTGTMGGLLESRTDEEQPLTATRISGSDSRVFHPPEASITAADKNSTTTVGTGPQISVEEDENTSKSVKIAVIKEQEQFLPLTTESQIADKHDNTDDLHKIPLKSPLINIESEVEDIADDSERSIMQRRRDAMNNQHQQRTIKNVGYRLGKRKRLFEKRCRISDFSLSFAVFGILVMLIETELTFAGVYEKDSIYSFITKTCVSISTCILLGLILAYHVYVIKIFSCDDSIEDWRMAVDYNRIFQMTLEVLICVIHPFPGSYLIQFPVSSSLVGPGTEIYSPLYHGQQTTKSMNLNNLTRMTTKLTANRTTSFKPFSGLSTFPSHITATTSSPFISTTSSSFDHVQSYSVKMVSIDLILSVPMFFRLYLLFRVMLLHSKLFTDAGSRSIGAMNKVSFDTRFIFKTLMTMCPGKLLLGFILCLWIVYSWTLRACESFYDTENGSLLNSMWLIAVTFLSIGYGDIVPHTYCGRVIALATGVMGSGCTALVVAVFARKLELSKAEKHVIHFMMENQLNKKVKNYAANVLRETWLIYKYTKLVKHVDASKVRTHQRKFLRAIHGLRRMKTRSKKSSRFCKTLVDLAKTQTNIYEIVTDLQMEQGCLQHRMETLESSLIKVQEQLRALPGLIRTVIIQQHLAYQKLITAPVSTTSVNQPITLKPEEHKS
ncbi:unnamed protein product [Schistosoma turkestanicum]|nr:unnamed protein product [Schistosoma turkestanicum]